MAEIFPATLQQLVNQSGFGLQFGDTTISSTVDVGPKKKRSRYTKGIDIFTCTIDMNLTDYNTLRTFYVTTLGNGVKTFLYDHPMTGVESVFRFTAPPSLSTLGGTYFRVQMTWELMP